MNRVEEPKEKWGGSWTERKLDAFEKYVRAYLAIMQAQKEKYNGWPNTIYFDGFAGSGSRNDNTTDEQNTLLEFEDITQEEQDVYKGSAERVLRLDKKFDHYCFVDNDTQSLQLLESTLREKNLVTNKCTFINDDVNNQLTCLCNFLDKGKAALVLLDPFGMQASQLGEY